MIIAMKSETVQKTECEKERGNEMSIFEFVNEE